MSSVVGKEPEQGTSSGNTTERNNSSQSYRESWEERNVQNSTPAANNEAPSKGSGFFDSLKTLVGLGNAGEIVSPGNHNESLNTGNSSSSQVTPGNVSYREKDNGSDQRYRTSDNQDNQYNDNRYNENPDTRNGADARNEATDGRSSSSLPNRERFGMNQRDGEEEQGNREQRYGQGVGESNQRSNERPLDLRVSAR